MLTFTFRVGFALSKDALMAGGVDAGFRTVTTCGTDLVDARLAAEQMVATYNGPSPSPSTVGFEPTSVEVIA